METVLAPQAARRASETHWPVPFLIATIYVRTATAWAVITGQWGLPDARCLDDSQAATASAPPSGPTLTGLVQHMAEVKRVLCIVGQAGRCHQVRSPAAGRRR